MKTAIAVGKMDAYGTGQFCDDDHTRLGVILDPTKLRLRARPGAWLECVLLAKKAVTKTRPGSGISPIIIS